MPSHSPHVLLLELECGNGEELAKQLARAGIAVDLVTSAEDAYGALRAIYYHSCVVISGLGRAGQLEVIARLRSSAAHVWMIVLCGAHEIADEPTLSRARRMGADAILSAPYSVHDLASRLAAFSLRSRPTF